MSHKATDPKLTAGPSFVTDHFNLNIAQLLLEYLKLEGVKSIFGIPGGALIYLIDELKLQSDEFDFVICRHETGAAYIAHGYAAVSGELGVVLTTAGPAACNAVTGSMNAQASNVSLLTITGEVPQKYFGEGYLQEGVDARLDINAIYRNAVEFSTVISSPENFPTLFQQALREARSLPGRASHVSLPNNIAGECAAGELSKDGKCLRIPFPKGTGNYRTLPSGTDVAKVKAAFDDLAGATKPLFFLGNGTREALRDPDRLARFEALVDRWSIPVMNTPDGKGIFPENHPMSLRNYGMCACSWPGLYIGKPGKAGHYDALMVLCSTLGELSTSVVATYKYSKNLIPTDHFIQVDLDQSVIGRDFPITNGIVAEVGATIDAMCEYGMSRSIEGGVDARKRLIAELKEANSPFDDSEARASEAAPIHPAALVRVMNDTIGDGHIFIDAGNCVGWSLNYLVVDPPLRYHSALIMGPMGFGVGAVVGGKVAAPDKPCVALVGDGAFMMHGAEISTAAQNGIGAVWVVLNDNDLSMVTQGMAVLFPPAEDWDDYYKLGAPDLVKFSQGLGADAVAVTKDEGPAAFEAKLKGAIQRAQSDRKPQVVVADIDTKPMPPYGWPHLKKSTCPPQS